MNTKNQSSKFPSAAEMAAALPPIPEGYKRYKVIYIARNGFVATWENYAPSVDAFIADLFAHKPDFVKRITELYEICSTPTAPYSEQPIDPAPYNYRR